MRFRPCIDIHNGKVKQIVGSSLTDKNDGAKENFVSEKTAEEYALLYRSNRLFGGHIVLLNGRESSYYKEDITQAKAALQAFPGGLQIGGGIHADNAVEFIAAGASHVIVTSYVFQDGKIDYSNLEKLVATVGREHLVLDLSCRQKADERKERRESAPYYVVTDRWQKFSEECLSISLLEKLSMYCDEFLIHAVDVEGKSTGIENNVLQLLSGWDKCPVTYAGGIGTMEDIVKIATLGGGKIDFTVGSALDLFGGTLSYQAICKKYGDRT